MLQAKYRKVVWFLLAVQLLLAHCWGIGRLYVNLKLLLYRVFPRLAVLPFPDIRPFLLAGALLTALWQIHSYQNFRKKALRGICPVEETWIQGIHLQAAKEAGCKNVLPLYRSSAVETPMVIGFSSQILLIPEEEYSSDALRMIFLHEYIHVRSRDMWYKLLFTAGTCLLWYQPLMYFLKGAAFRDVETACDQKAVEGKSGMARSAYGQLLIDSLKKSRSRELPYSAYFYNSRAVMEARLAVVMDERERPGYLGALFCLLLGVETVVLVLSFGMFTFQEIRYEQKPAPEVNIYNGFELPESFTAKAAESMAAVEAADDWGEEHLTALSEEEGPVPPEERQAVGPWQIDNPYEYWRAVPDFLFRYVMYYENQERGSQKEPELSRFVTGSTGVEIRESCLLLGNEEEFVYAVRFRQFMADEAETRAMKEALGGETGYEDGCEYLYHDWALHIRRVKENLYELVGVAELSEAEKACGEDRFSVQYHEFGEIDFWQRPKGRVQTLNGVTEITWDNGKNWREVPIALEKLTARGDQMDGILYSPQDKSYVISETMTAFAYGGSGEIPVTVSCSTDQGLTWDTSVVTHAYVSVRRLFLSFPDPQHGFLVVTSDRTMYQEASTLFRTEDGGKTWKEIGPAGPGPNEGHSLTTGAEFLTPEVGFVTIRSSQDPDLYRTADGGETWERQELPDIPVELAEDYALERMAGQEEWIEYRSLLGAMGYCMAYPPEWDGGPELKLYITMEEYSELGGTKARYHSEDMGESWIFDGYVTRR